MRERKDILYSRWFCNLSVKRRDIIKINTVEFREWKAKQNKKNLIMRTKKREAVRARRFRQQEYNRTIKGVSQYDIRNGCFKFEAPPVFSFIKDPETTTDFFKNLTSFILQKKNFGKSIYIDISQIKVLTIDALMYLLAIINNLKRNLQLNYSFSGNVPCDPEIKTLLIKSGFFQYVKYTGKGSLERDTDKVQIVSGENVVTAMAKKISDFVCAKAGINKSKCSFLYNMMIELMSNAHNHAYNQQETIIDPQWYCSADYNVETNVAEFTFMDTGEGIPSTVKKKIMERLDFLKFKGDNTYVVSALNGEFRTETLKPYRGKGLPKIREFCEKDKIQNMRIITNQADVTVHDNVCDAKDLSVSLMGTLFYWQIDLSKIREEAL